MVLRLIERFFNLSKLFVQGGTGIGDGLRLNSDALNQIINLPLHVANLNDCVVGFGELVANLERQVQLL